MFTREASVLAAHPPFLAASVWANALGLWISSVTFIIYLVLSFEGLTSINHLIGPSLTWLGFIVSFSSVMIVLKKVKATCP